MIRHNIAQLFAIYSRMAGCPSKDRMVCYCWSDNLCHTYHSGTHRHRATVISDAGYGDKKHLLVMFVTCSSAPHCYLYNESERPSKKCCFLEVWIYDTTGVSCDHQANESEAALTASWLPAHQT